MNQKLIAKRAPLSQRSSAQRTQVRTHAERCADTQTLRAAVQNPAAASPAQLLSLQRAYGNYAVGTVIQRAAQVGAAGGAVDATTQRAIQSARCGGAPLDGRVGAQAGSALGADFGGVKVHTDANADRLSRSLSAEAFTLGSDIFFRSGAYKPSTHSGQKLLAHELTHVVQQGGGGNKIQAKFKVGPANNGYEREADRVAATFGARPQVARKFALTAKRMPAAVSSSVIQRKLGFEFEANFRTHAFDRQQNNGNAMSADQKEGRKAYPPATALKAFPKGIVLASGSRFEVQTDELPSGKASDLEFVTTLPPFDETPTERNALKKTMDDIKSIGDTLTQSTNKFIEVRELPNVAAQKPDALIEQNTNVKVLQGAPQATIALRLDQVNKFMGDTGAPRGIADPKHAAGREDLMGMGKQDTDRQIASRAAARAQKAVEVYRKTLKAQKNLQDTEMQIGSRELIGLVTLLTAYLIRGDEENLSYAKNITILLARTDFATMFKQLTAQEQKHFKAHNGQAFVELVLSAAGLAGTDDVPVFKGGLNYKQTPQEQGVLNDLTRGKWLRSITKGKDLMTGKHIGKGRKREMESLGALGKRTEKVGRGVNAPIFEMRRIKNQVPYTQWPTLALDIFDYVVKMNLGKDTRYKRKNEEARQDELLHQQQQEWNDYMQQRQQTEEF